MKDLHQQFLDTCISAGIVMIGCDLAARILAVVYKYDDENITHSPKLRADLEYIKKQYYIGGGQIADTRLVELLKERIATLPDDRDKIPTWATKLFKERYNLNL